MLSETDDVCVLMEIVIKDGLGSSLVGQAKLFLRIRVIIFVIGDGRGSQSRSWWHFYWSEYVNLGVVVFILRRDKFLAVGREAFKDVPAELSLLDLFWDN